MSDMDHQHHQFGLANLVDNAPVADPHPPQSLA
jgi:hypothetical protein